jgi:hypothetical protein
VIVNGYKPLSDWYVLGAICFVMMLIGMILGQVLNPLPREIQEVRVELMRCHRETQEVCSLVTMPASSHAAVYLLYSQYVK